MAGGSRRITDGASDPLDGVANQTCCAAHGLADRVGETSHKPTNGASQAAEQVGLLRCSGGVLFAEINILNGCLRARHSCP